MSKKLYQQTDDGGIKFDSTRKPGEVRIPNYVYDIWMPLLGIEVIGVYAVYCRLEREGQVRGLTQAQIAASCKVGTRRLDDINTLLEKCGFIKAHKPDKKQRSKHIITTITVKDPPTFVKADFIAEHDKDRKAKYIPLTAWLVESSTETSNDISSETSNDNAAKHQMELRETSNDISSETSNDNATIATLEIATLEIATLELQPSTATPAPPLATVPVVSANNVPMLLPEMLPPKPDALKEKVQAERSAETPSPSSAAPLPVDDFSIVRLHRELWPDVKITPAMRDMLFEDAKKYPKDWITDAFKQATANHAKAYSYIRKVLTEWEAKGRTPNLAILPKSTPTKQWTPTENKVVETDLTPEEIDANMRAIMNGGKTNASA